MFGCCMPFTRTNHFGKFANAIHVLPKPIDHIQGRFCCRTFSYIRKMDGTKDKQHTVDMQKKHKTMTPKWRPVSSKSSSDDVIEGASIKDITKTSEKNQVVLAEPIKSPSLDYSHFISLPLAIHSGLVEKLIDFQNSILGNPYSSQEKNLDSDTNEDTSDKAEDLGIDKSIFIKPKTFHLTVLMLKLWNKDRVAAAAEVLQRISPKVNDALDGRPISVKLTGLECMKGSLEKARVLYAPIEEIGGEDRILRACQVIIDAYVEAGLVLEGDAHQKLKLHATVMNVRHRKRKNKTRKRFDTFDAREVFKQYGSQEWGEYLIREAHLSQRFAFDDDGYYHCCTSIPFP